MLISQTHDRLQQHRIRLCDTLLECQRSGDLERHFVGVNVVIRTVIKHGLDIYHRVARKRTFFHTFDDALFYCRNIVLRNGAAEQLFREIEHLVRRRRKPDMNVAVLACAAGLLLMLALYIGMAFDRLAVSDLSRGS